MASYLTTILSRQDFEVDAASTAEDGLAQMDYAEHQLVLLDLGLPDGTGADVMRGLRERQLNIPVLIVTGAAPNDDRVNECLKMGAVGCVRKTAPVATLLAAVGQLLGA